MANFINVEFCQKPWTLGSTQHFCAIYSKQIHSHVTLSFNTCANIPGLESIPSILSYPCFITSAPSNPVPAARSRI